MTTDMRREINEIPQVTSRLLAQSAGDLSAAGRALAEANPRFAMTVARGSSDHAAHFLKYTIPMAARIPVASVGPSLASIYSVVPQVPDSVAIAISQSGQSPDIVAMTEALGKGGALSIALCNVVPSPLDQASDHTIPLQAGKELSVAATKSFVTSIVAGLALQAEWTKDDALAAALKNLPQSMQQALALEWTGFSEALDKSSSLYVLGRGPSYAIACEAALKFKETCGLHAEAYSAAEVLHGPSEIIDENFPVLVFATGDAGDQSVLETAGQLAARGAPVFVTNADVAGAQHLPTINTGHAFTDALLAIIPFYGFAEAHSRRSGRNPDKPKTLNKVTMTR